MAKLILLLLLSKKPQYPPDYLKVDVYGPIPEVANPQRTFSPDPRTMGIGARNRQEGRIK